MEGEAVAEVDDLRIERRHEGQPSVARAGERDREREREPSREQVASAIHGNLQSEKFPRRGVRWRPAAPLYVEPILERAGTHRTAEAEAPPGGGKSYAGGSRGTSANPRRARAVGTVALFRPESDIAPFRLVVRRGPAGSSAYPKIPDIGEDRI